MFERRLARLTGLDGDVAGIGRGVPVGRRVLDQPPATGRDVAEEYLAVVAAVVAVAGARLVARRVAARRDRDAGARKRVPLVVPDVDLEVAGLGGRRLRRIVRHVGLTAALGQVELDRADAVVPGRGRRLGQRVLTGLDT